MAKIKKIACNVDIEEVISEVKEIDAMYFKQIKKDYEEALRKKEFLKLRGAGFAPSPGGEYTSPNIDLTNETETFGELKTSIF